MLFIITIVSIFIIGLLIWLANRFLPFKICPICAGVSGTWIWLMIGYFLGYQINLVIPSMLMGGSVVGLAFQLGEKLGRGKSLILWKTLFMPAGFVLAYSILFKEWLLFSAALIFLLVIAFLFLSKNEKKSDRQVVEELKKKMDNCC
ncbi:MAG: hypothetical protein AAB350_01225 [Patescibacteria group bacterium]|mgnify:CR=1 FL=1